MIMSICRWPLLILAALALAACQAPLRSDLPQGPAAYEAVAVSESAQLALSSQLRSRDEISVNVFQEEDLTIERLVIDPAGNVSLPLIGEIKAAGLSPAQLGGVIERAYGARFLRDPHVTVILHEGYSRIVSVEGEVERPGVYEVQQGYTLLSALALAGSPSDTAKTNEILIFREVDGQRMGGRFDLVEVRAGRSPDPAILPDDVIVVGFSAVRGLYQDFLQAAPILGVFTRF